MAPTRQRSGSRATRSVRGRRPAAARKRTGNAPARRKALRRRWVAVLSVLTVLGLGYTVGFTELLAVRSIEVSGTDRIEQATVLDLAAIPRLRPMVRADTDGIEQRIAKVPQVERVVVSRTWPSTITIEITERHPVAYFVAHDGIRLVDRAGVPFHEVGKRPKKLPRLKVETVAASDQATGAAMRVLTAIPDKLRKRVTEVSADTGNSVELRLTKGKVVRWGNAAQIERKAQVLGALLSRPGEYYDVSSPELPTVR
ncbi:MAG: FtsQ-type POTRA domain-containing protein [Actinophytocola sp.]|nr:FtsQ-type POTRA domain-containing protein [Actinophytocola sp.]